MKNNTLPSFYGILEVQHYIPGRIRAKVEKIINNEEKAEEVRIKLLKLTGIKEVQINTLIGSIMVKFDESVIEPVLLLGIILNFMELEEEAFGRKNGKLSFLLKDILEAADMTLYNKTKGLLDIKTVITMFFITYGIKKLRQNPVMPNGVNLLWWSYNLISKGGKQ